MNYVVISDKPETGSEDNQSTLSYSTKLYGEQDNTFENSDDLFSEFSDSTATNYSSSDMTKTELSIYYM